MDIDAFIADLRAALKLLPRDVVNNVLGSIVGNLPALVMVWPELRRLMEPHVKACMVAYPAGILDMDEIQKGVQSVLGDYFAGNV